jgi:hypothetical protein
MRFRLTKQNVEDLVGGKELKYGKIRYQLQEGETQERKTLRLILDSGELGKRAAVFIDKDTSQIQIEIDGERITGKEAEK